MVPRGARIVVGDRGPEIIHQPARKRRKRPGTRPPTLYAVARRRGGKLEFVGAVPAHDGPTAIRALVDEGDRGTYTFSPLSIWQRKLDARGQPIGAD